jgi:hypothetical protein
VSECDREASIMRRPWPSRGCCAVGKKYGALSSPGYVTLTRTDEVGGMQKEAVLA